MLSRAAGAALAGFALVLFGLTTLQQGMGGLADRLHPADLPAVLAGPDAGWWWGMLGVLVLTVVGLVMTALMQSSTAAIAVTLSAHYAGAVGLDGKNAYALLGRAYVRVQQSAVSNGLADVEEALREAPASAALLVNAACVYSLALGKLDVKSTKEQQLRSQCEQRSVQLLNQALDLVPARDRADFWARYVKANPDLRALRQVPAMAQLDRKYSGSSR